MDVYCGIDWAEDHHDIALADRDGKLLARRRISDDAAGLAALLALLAEHGDTPDDPIPVAIETPRGLLVACLRATGRRVYPINPMAVARYRDRHSGSGRKSDHGDSFVLANVLRTDIHAHRPLPADTELAQAIAVLARAQQDAVWDRTTAHNKLRSHLREYYPGFLAAFAPVKGGILRPEARTILAAAPTPADAARLGALGAPEAIVTGNLKFDVSIPSHTHELAAGLRLRFGATRPTWLAASTRDGEEAMQDYRKGQMVRVKVLDVDVEKERISLGIKQLENDPFEAGLGKIKKGDVVTAKISGSSDNGIDVTLPDGMPGFIRKSELSRDRSEQRPDRFAVGEKVDAKVTAIDRATRKVTLSIKAREMDEEKRAMAEFGSSDSGASLSDILGAAIRRRQIDADEKSLSSLNPYQPFANIVLLPRRKPGPKAPTDARAPG